MRSEPILTVAQLGTIASWLGVVLGALEIFYGVRLWRSEAKRSDGVAASNNLPLQGQSLVCSGLMLVLLAGNYLVRGTMPEGVQLTLFSIAFVAMFWWQIRLWRQEKRASVSLANEGPSAP